MLASSGQGLPLALSRREARSIPCLPSFQRTSRCQDALHTNRYASRHTGCSAQPVRLPGSRPQKRCDSFTVRAQKGPPDPPDAPREERRGGREWLQTLLSRFGPITQKAENTAVLDFEKPLVELDNRIKEVKLVSMLLSQTWCMPQISKQSCTAGSKSCRRKWCRCVGVD